MTTTVKKRRLSDLYDRQYKGTLTLWTENSSGGIVDPKVSTKGQFVRNPNNPPGSEVTQSESHPDWGRSRTRTFSNDVGGPFQNIKSYVYAEHPYRQRINEMVETSFPTRRYYANYIGPLYAADPSGIAVPSYSLDNLANLGSTAISRCKPTNNVADLATFLAELRSDGLPKLFGATLWEKNTSVARKAGGEYLNSEFGWKPLVGDVTDVMSALTHARAILEQYERGSGRVTRRQYRFPVEKTRSTALYVGSYVPTTTPSYGWERSGKQGQVFRISSSRTETWFSGAFTYHLPTGYHSRNRLIDAGNKAKALLGLDLTPEVIWNASPWSWAIDWFSNAGDVISNLSDWSTDGLVLKYGYIMQHKVVMDSYYLVGPTGLQDKLAYASPIHACVEIKRRQEATPFGFGLNWNGLSPRQLAISAALGLTRRF